MMNLKRFTLRNPSQARKGRAGENSNFHYGPGHLPFAVCSPGFSRFSRGDRLKPGLHTSQTENCCGENSATLRTLAKVATSPLGNTGQSAFTMVEIALCLGIVVFALVAIVGVLPTGLKVQKENLEETIINQDGVFLMEAIRSGSKGLDDLTNYVESITIKYGSQAPVTFTNSVRLVPNRLTNGLHIVGLLSTPKTERLPDGTFRQNSVTARVRAINGVASEKGRQGEESSFRYQLISEVVPFVNRPPFGSQSTTDDLRRSAYLLNNLYDVRLTVRWPLFQRGVNWETGRGRKTFRTLVAGELHGFGPPKSASYLYFFEPNAFVSTNSFSSTF